MAAASPTPPADLYYTRRFEFATLRDATRGFSDDCRMAAGSTSEVFKCELDGIAIAVKRLKLPVGATAVDQHELQRRFRRELHVLGTYRHERIVRMLGFAEDGAEDGGDLRYPFALVVEWLSGESLADWLREPGGAPARRSHTGGSSLSAFERVDAALGAAQGLEFLHDRGVLHRDVKSANIGFAQARLDGPLFAKLFDVGLAKALRGSAAALDFGHSFTGSMSGTKGYMAPELVDTEASVCTEVFSFGAVLLELLMGRRVRPSEARLAQGKSDEELGALAEEGVWPPPARNALIALIHQCLDEPEARLASMRSVLDRLFIIRDRITNVPASVFCCQCIDTVPLSGALECHNKDDVHYLCNGHLQLYIEALIDEPRLLRLSADGGLVPCPAINCNSQWTLAELLPFIDASVSDRLRRLGHVRIFRFEEHLARINALYKRAVLVASALTTPQELAQCIYESDSRVVCPRPLCKAELDLSSSALPRCQNCSWFICPVCVLEFGSSVDLRLHAMSAHGRRKLDSLFFLHIRDARMRESLYLHISALPTDDLRASVLRELASKLNCHGISAQELLRDAHVQPSTENASYAAVMELRQHLGAGASPRVIEAACKSLCSFLGGRGLTVVERAAEVLHVPPKSLVDVPPSLSSVLISPLTVLERRSAEAIVAGVPYALVAALEELLDATSPDKMSVAECAYALSATMTNTRSRDACTAAGVAHVLVCALTVFSRDADCAATVLPICTALQSLCFYESSAVANVRQEDCYEAGAIDVLFHVLSVYKADPLVCAMAVTALHNIAMYRVAEFFSRPHTIAALVAALIEHPREEPLAFATLHTLRLEPITTLDTVEHIRALAATLGFCYRSPRLSIDAGILISRIGATASGRAACLDADAGVLSTLESALTFQSLRRSCPSSLPSSAA